MLITNLIIFIFAAILLGRSATLLVKSLIKIGQYLKIGEFAISFILMAFATSLPELFVAILSSVNGSPDLAIGTVIGSNIADMTLVIGIAAVAAGVIRVKSAIKKRDLIYMSGILFILILLMLDGSLTRPDAAILLMIYAYYIFRLFTQRERFESKKVKISRREYYENIGRFTVCIIGLVLSARLLVWSSETIAVILSIPLILVGLIILALGTSLPEISFELSAIKEKRQDMVLGDVIGSVVTNSALIIGVTGMINPIHELDLDLINIGLISLVIITFGLLFFIRNDGKITTKEALILLFFYLFFVSMEYLARIVKI